MTVIVASHPPPAVRGLLKRWFIEPLPNVFVGTVNTRTREKVIAYILRHGQEMGILVISSDDSAQGFQIESFGETPRRVIRECGLALIGEKWPEPPPPDA